MSGMCDDMCDVLYDVMLYNNVVQSIVVERHTNTRSIGEANVGYAQYTFLV